MAYQGQHNATHQWDTAVLETFIPGYSIASRILATYFQLDLSFYLPAIVATTIALAAVKYCTAWLTSLFQNYFISTAEIRLDDEIYTYLMFWVARQPFTSRTTRFVAGTKIKGGGRYYYDSDDESDPDGEDLDEDDCGSDEASFDNYWTKMINRDKFKRLRFTPSQGTHYFRYKGRYVAFSREQEDSNKNPYATSWTPERLYLSCAGRNPTIIKDLLSEAQRAYVARDGNRTVIYRGQKSAGDYWDWVRCMARPPRPLSTVVLDAAQKKAFVDDIKEYLHPRTRRWYSNRGIPYRRGYLLHGPPGTGKTSLCFAASGLLGLTLYLLNLNSKSLDEDSLMSLFQDLPSRCIVLLEDVDSAGITKKRDEADNNTDSGNKPLPPPNTTPETTTKEECEKPPATGLSLSALLNVIDGVAASEGRILVMTTNHAEKLDPALLRPGRVDMSVVFGYAETADIKELFSAIYSTLDGDFGSRKRKARQVNGSVTPSSRSSTPSSSSSSSTSTSPIREKHTKLETQQNQDTVAKQASEFAFRVPPGEFTAAEIQGYLLNHKNAPEDAIEGAEEWVRGVQKKREEKRV